MNDKKHIAACALLATAALWSASASAQIVRGPTAATQTRAYVGVGGGQNRLDAECGPFACDKSDMGWKVFGGYNFNPWLGIEGGYYDLGTAQIYVPPAAGQIDTSAIAAFATFRAEENDWWVAAKLGVASVKTEGRAIGGTTTIGLGSETKTDFAWGLGIGYNFYSQFRVQLEYEQFKGELQGEKADSGFTSLSLVYRF